ncbi:MAG: cysteine--tRNA ligase [Chloroflexi bacterium]|nr:cysteine--tRNA ligase [Chloroflexota bacterium]
MKLYNTLTGHKEEFKPNSSPVKMYVCGITPYAPSHLGHAMSYVIFDVLRRYLEFRGFQVRHVQNFTDIEDKIIQRAARLNISTEELSERYIDEYFEDMAALNILQAHVYPRATREIPRIIEIIRVLIDRGYAYSVKGDVYFRVQKVEDYGRLSRRTLDGLLAGDGPDKETNKEHQGDFALWKGAKTGEPFWDSPWGKGRPGWHIECTAMSLYYLGETLDIHGGGQDLIFPHHENEIVQSESYTSVTPFSRFWVHNGLLRLGEDKMSKSLGNLVTVTEALGQFNPDTIRLFFLASHYRSPLTYSHEAIIAQERAVERLRNAAKDGDSSELPSLDPEPFRTRFLTAMDDDLNTPQALAALFDLAREINRRREDSQSVAEAQHTLKGLAIILGLTLEESQPPGRGDTSALIQLLVETRAELRAANRYDLADKIRASLVELGVTLEDTAQGTKWKHKPS